MILGMPARRLAAAGPTFSGWELSSTSESSGTSFDDDFEWARGSDRVRLLSKVAKDAATGGKYAIRIAVGTTSGGAARPPVPGFGYAEVATEALFGTYLGDRPDSYGLWVNDSGSNERAYENGSVKNLGDLTDAKEWPLFSEVMIEIDLDNRMAWFGADGNWESGANPATQTLPTYTLPDPGSVTNRVFLMLDFFYAGGRARLLRPDEFGVAATSGFTPGWPD